MAATKCPRCRGTGFYIVRKDGLDVAMPCDCRKAAAAAPASGHAAPTATAVPLTLKQQAAEYRRMLAAQREHEKDLRDLLLLCLPRAVIVNHLEALRDIRNWFQSRHFEHERRSYPFNPEHFRQAVKMLWDYGFTPNGKSNAEGTLNYLKKVMITLHDKDQTAQQQRMERSAISSMGDVLNAIQRKGTALQSDEHTT